MGRIKGLSSFSANFDILMAAPIDSRSVVDTVADLNNPETWKGNDGNTYLYAGLLVAVLEDKSVYMLIDPDNLVWEKLKGEGGGGETKPTVHTQHILLATDWKETEDGFYAYILTDANIASNSLVQAIGTKESNQVIAEARFQAYMDIEPQTLTIYAEYLPTEDITIELYIEEVEE